ncbi:MAG: hypothetical protein ACK4WH_13600 [Phycisphaerales bacterium]
MKRIWIILSTLAIGNMLAIVGFVLWLHTTDRLSRERFESVRSMFRITLTQEASAKAEEQARAEAARALTEAEARAAAPPETAADRLAERQALDEQHFQKMQRKQQELENLKSFILRQISDVERREAELAADRAAFKAERDRIVQTEATSQFKAALATLEAQKPRDARLVLEALLNANQTDQVIVYLAGLDEGKRGKILAEFIKDQPAVAADLLERIRTRGQPASAPDAQPGSPGGASAAAR